MRRLNAIWIIIWGTLLTGCGENNVPNDDLITINVSNKYPKKEFILQNLFDIEYIPLETSNEFVTTGILQGLDENLLVLKDRGWTSTGNIYFTDRQGKYLKTINRKGQGGEEYVALSAVIYDKENQEIFISDLSLKKIVVYDLDGNFKRSFNPIEGIYYDVVGNFDKDYLICNCKPEGAPDDNGYEAGALNNGFVLVSKLNGDIRKIEIPYEKYVSPYLFWDTPEGKRYTGIINDPQIPYQGDWLLVEISSDTIYRYQNHTRKPFIVRTPTASSMIPEVYLFPGVITDRYYFLQSVKKEYDKEKRIGFPTTELLYDKEENAIYEYAIYNSDFTDKRPLSLVYEFPIAPMIINDNGIAYITRLDAHDLVEAYENGKLRGPLEEIAANLEEEDNPVIMIAKYKK